MARCIPILHLNGYKIAGPTVLARIGRDELTELLQGYGYKPYFVEGDDPELMHQLMAGTLDTVIAEIRDIQQRRARERISERRPAWPMIVLRTPKGWTGPKDVDGVQIEGTFRAHQVPLSELATKPDHIEDSGRLDEELPARGACSTRPANSSPNWPSWRPKASGAWARIRTPTAACCLRDLQMPDFRDYAVDVPKPGGSHGRSHARPGQHAARRDASSMQDRATSAFSVPMRPTSNRLDAVFEVDRSRFRPPQFFPTTITSPPTAASWKC